MMLQLGKNAKGIYGMASVCRSSVFSLVLATLACTGTVFAQNADVEAGKRVYTRRCASCHGANGEGRAATARNYGVQMRHLGSAEVQALRDDEWRRLLKEGGKKTKPVRNLSDVDITNVIAYCRTLKQIAQ